MAQNSKTNIKRIVRKNSKCFHSKAFIVNLLPITLIRNAVRKIPTTWKLTYVLNFRYTGTHSIWREKLRASRVQFIEKIYRITLHTENNNTAGTIRVNTYVFRNKNYRKVRSRETQTKNTTTKIRKQHENSLEAYKVTTG